MVLLRKPCDHVTRGLVVEAEQLAHQFPDADERRISPGRLHVHPPPLASSRERDATPQGCRLGENAVSMGGASLSVACVLSLLDDNHPGNFPGKRVCSTLRDPKE